MSVAGHDEFSRFVIQLGPGHSERHFHSQKWLNSVRTAAVVLLQKKNKILHWLSMLMQSEASAPLPLTVHSQAWRPGRWPKFTCTIVVVVFRICDIATALTCRESDLSPIVLRVGAVKQWARSPLHLRSATFSKFWSTEKYFVFEAVHF